MRPSKTSAVSVALSIKAGLWITINRLSLYFEIIRAEGLIPAVPLPPRTAVVPNSSNVVAEPQLAVKTIHGCIVLTNALRGNKGDENRLQSPYRTHSAKRWALCPDALRRGCWLRRWERRKDVRRMPYGMIICILTLCSSWQLWEFRWILFNQNKCSRMLDWPV